MRPARSTASVAYEDLIAANEPMARIERPEDDIYMLYTGGTTGMPKGVMYTVGGITQGFITLGYPLLALEPPTEVAVLGDLVKAAHEAGNTLVSIPGCPLMHGTGMWLGSMIPMLAGGRVVTLENRSLDPHELLSVDGTRAGHHHRHRRRRLRQAAQPRHRRGHRAGRRRTTCRA